MNSDIDQIQAQMDTTMVRAVEELEMAVSAAISHFISTYGFMPTIRAIPIEKRGHGFSFTVEVTELKPPLRGLRSEEGTP